MRQIVSPTEREEMKPSAVHPPPRNHPDQGVEQQQIYGQDHTSHPKKSERSAELVSKQPNKACELTKAHTRPGTKQAH